MQAHASHVAVFLTRQGRQPTEDRQIEAHVKFLHQPTNKSFSTHFYSVDKEDVGTPTFLSRDSFLPKLPNGAFVVHVELQVMLDEISAAAPPLPTFSSFMSQLQLLEEFSDVTFVVEGQDFKEH